MQLLINMQIYKQQRESRGNRAVFSQNDINIHDWTVHHDIRIPWGYHTVTNQCFPLWYRLDLVSIGQEDVKSKEKGGNTAGEIKQLARLSESGNWFHYMIS